MTKRFTTLLVLLATVAMTTTFVVIPMGGGYFNFSDIAVVFSGLFIAHFLGTDKPTNLFFAFIVPGIGAGIADYYLGYTIFAPITLIAKGLEGTMAYLSYKKRGVLHLGILLIGGILMAGTYFVAEAFILKDLGGIEYAIGEIFPTNTIQVIGGIIGGRILFLIASKILKNEVTA